MPGISAEVRGGGGGDEGGGGGSRGRGRAPTRPASLLPPSQDNGNGQVYQPVITNMYRREGPPSGNTGNPC